MASIGFVHDNPNPSTNDNAAVTWLENAGHTVTLISESASPPTEGTYDLIIISESGSSSSVAQYDTYGDPVMCWETAWNSLRLTSAGASTATSTTQCALTSHESVSELSSPVTYLNSSQSMFGVASSTLASGVDIVATHPSTTTHCFIIVADEGATLTSGTAPAKRCCMGFTDSRVGNLSANGQALALAMVEWMVGAAEPPSEGTASGAYDFSGTATGATPLPGTPQNLTATAVSSSQIDLAWDEVSGVSGYDIERDSVVIVKDHTDTTYSDTGLDPETEYTYRVRSVE